MTPQAQDQTALAKHEASHVEVSNPPNEVSEGYDDEKFQPSSKGQDAAAAYLNPDLIITEEENVRLRRLIHKRVLPLMCLAYITQALDKGTLAPAA